MKNLSNWRAVRVWEGELERELRPRHTLWLRGPWLGALVLGVMWAASPLQRLIGAVVRRGLYRCDFRAGELLLRRHQGRDELFPLAQGAGGGQALVHGLADE